MINPTLNGFDASLETLLNWKVTKTFIHVKNLQDYCIKLISELEEFSVSSSLETNERSGIIKIDHQNSESIVRYLETLQITVAYRDRGIRVSPHRYNTKTDIEKLVEGIQSSMKKNSMSS